nr:hypothetical protein Iba_chr15cCG8980 [Ipomoea batatas]
MGSVVDQLTIADAITGKWLLLLPVSSVAVQRRCPPASLPRSPSSPIASSSTAVEPSRIMIMGKSSAV